VFLDAFARVRAAAGRPAASISWGTWSQIRGSDESHRTIDRGGMRIMSASRTLDAFTRLLRPVPAHVVFAQVDWQTLKPLYEARRPRPLLEEVGMHAAVRSPRDAAVPSAIRQRLAAARPAERRGILVAHVRQEAAHVLGLQPRQVDPRKGLFDLGMDSLMSVDLRSRLEASLGLEMPATLAFNYPSVDAIVDYVFPLLVETTPAPTAALTREDDEEPGEELSEDELASLLAAELERMRQ
jgi:myxalamid-type polyketide synthase MxaE and MxaD